MYHRFFVSFSLSRSAPSNTELTSHTFLAFWIRYFMWDTLLAAALKILNFHDREGLRKTSPLNVRCNERKINSKRKIVTKVLLTWSKMHYHNGNSCFGRTNVSLLFNSTLNSCPFFCFLEFQPFANCALSISVYVCMFPSARIVL